VSDRRVHQTRIVITRWLSQTAADDHAVTVANTAMTGGAKNVEALLAAREVCRRDLNWKEIDVLAILLSRITSRIYMQLSASHGVLDSGSRSASVIKKGCRGQRLIARLILHILATRCCTKRAREQKQ